MGTVYQIKYLGRIMSNIFFKKVLSENYQSYFVLLFKIRQDKRQRPLIYLNIKNTKF